MFTKEFTAEEGLGPLFNGRSCFECHGQPGVIGGEGRDVAGTGVVRIGRRVAGTPKSTRPLAEVIADLDKDDVDVLVHKGGPALQRKSITSEFPNKYPADCQIEFPEITPGTELISVRHAGPLFGFGLIDAIPDTTLIDLALRQATTHPDLAGRAILVPDPLTARPRVGRFGWKCQNAGLLAFTAEAMNVEMGITSLPQFLAKSSTGFAQFPPCINKLLPKEPNDDGRLATSLTFHQAMLAAPERGPITADVLSGEKVFDRLQCSVCHVPELRTAPVVKVVEPGTAFAKLRYVNVPALANQSVRAYSDFLLHQMGAGLADGLPQAGARGGEWRTTPLWGLRFKRFYLHDGRTSDLTEAILAHGGQCDDVVERFKQLGSKERQDLLAFLKSL